MSRSVIAHTCSSSVGCDDSIITPITAIPILTDGDTALLHPSIGKVPMSGLEGAVWEGVGGWLYVYTRFVQSFIYPFLHSAQLVYIVHTA